MIWWIIGIAIVVYVIYKGTSKKQSIPEAIEQVESLVDKLYPKIVEETHASIKEHEKNLKKDDPYPSSKKDLKMFIEIEREDLGTYEKVRQDYVALKERYKHDVQKQTQVVRDYFDYFSNIDYRNKNKERLINGFDFDHETVDSLREEIQDSYIKNKEILKRLQKGLY
jgi:hypothetical protein